jgi:hypothetical protein
MENFNDNVYTDFFGMIGNKFIMDDGIDNINVSVFTVVRTLFFDWNRHLSILNLHTLYEVLGVNKNQTKATNNIKDALQWLVNNSYIEINDFLMRETFKDVKKINTSSMLKIKFLQSSEFLAKNGGFAKVPDENLMRILNSVGYRDKYKIIRYYTLIARVCSNSGNWGSLSQNRAKEICGISANTCIEYNKILQDLGVIFYNNNYGRVNFKGEFKMTGTMFGHCNVYYMGDTLCKESFDGFVKNHAKEKGYNLINKEKLYKQDVQEEEITLTEEERLLVELDELCMN